MARRGRLDQPVDDLSSPLLSPTIRGVAGKGKEEQAK
jgi:hypothetical protein